MGPPNAGPGGNQPMANGQPRSMIDGPMDSHDGPPGMEGSRGMPNQRDRNGMMQNRPGMNRGRDGPPLNPERMDMMGRDDRGRGPPPGRGGHMDRGRGGGPMRGGRPLMGRGGPMGMDGPPMDQDGRPMRRDNRPSPYGRPGGPADGPRNMRNRGESLDDEQMDNPFPSMRGGRGRPGFRR